MQLGRIGFVGAVAGLVLGGLVAGAGCEGADDGGGSSSGGEAELRAGYPFHRWHPGRDAGSSGAAGDNGAGSAGSGGSAGAVGTNVSGTSADCDICAQAKRCCDVVESPDRCSFSADTCSSMTGAARPAYVNACLTYVVSVRGAWSGNPPAECR